MTRCIPARFVSIVLLALLAPAVHARITISQYEQNKDSKEFKIYVLGVGDALVLMNSTLYLEGKPRLFCPPANSSSALTANDLVDRYVGIIRESDGFKSQNIEAQASFPISAVLLYALMHENPCKEEQRANDIPSPNPMPQPAPIIQTPPIYQPPPLPTMPSVPFPNPPGRTETVCRKLSNGTVVCE